MAADGFAPSTRTGWLADADFIHSIVNDMISRRVERRPTGCDELPKWPCILGGRDRRPGVNRFT